MVRAHPYPGTRTWPSRGINAPDTGRSSRRRTLGVVDQTATIDSGGPVSPVRRPRPAVPPIHHRGGTVPPRDGGVAGPGRRLPSAALGRSGIRARAGSRPRPPDAHPQPAATGCVVRPGGLPRARGRRPGARCPAGLGQRRPRRLRAALARTERLVKSGSVRGGRRTARAAALASRRRARLRPGRRLNPRSNSKLRDDAARSPRVNDEELLLWFG